jgi:hypothetical protein
MIFEVSHHFCIFVFTGPVLGTVRLEKTSKAKPSFGEGFMQQSDDFLFLEKKNCHHWLRDASGLCQTNEN